jgi:CheY-like chemotaxis protein
VRSRCLTARTPLETARPAGAGRILLLAGSEVGRSPGGHEQPGRSSWVIAELSPQPLVSNHRVAAGRTADGVKTRVVVADDDRAFLELLLFQLGALPQLRVIGVALDGHEAVRLSVEQQADVALLDIDMPGLDGFAAALAIRREHPETALILHTGALIEEHRQLGAELGLAVFDKLDVFRTIERVGAHVGSRAH